MQTIRLVHVFVLTWSLAFTPAIASAQDDPQALRKEIDQLKADLEALRQQYAERLAALEARLSAAGLPPTALEAPGGQPPPPQAPLGQPATSSKVFNPDTSVIGNFAGVAGENPLSDQPTLSLTEAEAAFQAIVDPYGRADFFISAGPDEFEIEEGYLTLTALPAGLLLKVGKMREQFGKVNVMHTHVLPWIDRPLALRNLFGGDEGIADSGMSLAKLIPNRFMFLDAIGEVYFGASDVFQSESRSELNYLGRLRAYRDLTEGSNIDLGTSYAQGRSALSPGFTAQRIGVDATFRYRPLRRAIYRQFIGRTELLWSRERMAEATQRASGFFASGDYQFARRWFIGARVDRSGRPLEPDLHDSGGSIHMTFKPSEFSLIRGQYRHTSYAEDINANEFLFQFNFSIGAHGAHPF